jgi:hypothetical protein
VVYLIYKPRLLTEYGAEVLVIHAVAVSTLSPMTSSLLLAVMGRFSNEAH